MNKHTEKSPQTVTHHYRGPLFRKALCTVNNTFNKDPKGSPAGLTQSPCKQQSPIFLAPGTGFLEDLFFFFTDWGGGWFQADSSALHSSHTFYDYISSISHLQA